MHVLNLQKDKLHLPSQQLHTEAATKPHTRYACTNWKQTFKKHINT